MFTQNLFAAHPSIASDLYNSPKCSSTNKTLSKPYENLSPWYKNIKRISNITSCEIDNKLSTSPTENMRDLYLQSGQTWEQFVNASKLNKIRDYDQTTYQILKNYQYFFEITAFDTFTSYFDSKPPLFEGDANDIIYSQSQIYEMLKGVQSNRSECDSENTCIVFESRMKLHPDPSQNLHGHDSHEQKCNDDEDDDDDDDDDDYALSYNENVATSALNTVSKPQRLKFNDSTISTQNLSKENRINEETLQTMRNYLNHLNMDPFSYSHIECSFIENTVRLCEMDSSVTKSVIELRHNVYMILNSIHSIYNLMNTLTFLYIMYHDTIMIYSYITNANGKSYGLRITEKDLVTTIPALFTNNCIDVCVKPIQFKMDKTLEEYKLVLFKQQQSKRNIAVPLNTFYLQIQNTVNKYNAVRTVNTAFVDVEDIQIIMEKAKIKKRYFMNGNNHKLFIQLLEINNISIAFANELWYNLGGVPFGNIDIDKKEDGDTDLNFDELKVDIINESELKQQLIDKLSITNKLENELINLYQIKCNEMNDNHENNDECDEYMQCEEPPWNS